MCLSFEAAAMACTLVQKLKPARVGKTTRIRKFIRLLMTRLYSFMSKLG